MLGKFIAGVSIVFAGSTAALAGSACDYADHKICAETSSTNVGLNCQAADGGAVVTTCKTDARFATCLIKAQGADVYVRFYTGYASDAKADCEEAKGTYTAD